MRRVIRKVHNFNSTENSIFGISFLETISIPGKKKIIKLLILNKIISSGQEREISSASYEGFVNFVFQVVLIDVEKFELIIK